jgi:L-rhamnose mutarotase
MTTSTRPVRLGRRTRVKEAALAEYREWHKKVWPELLALNTAAGVRNYTIFLDGTTLFSYCEVDDPSAAQQLMMQSELGARWQALMAPFMDADDPNAPWTELEEVFHQD